RNSKTWYVARCAPGPRARRSNPEQPYGLARGPVSPWVARRGSAEDMTSDMAALERLIEDFTTQLAARGQEVVRFDTHLPVVLLAGRHAWKFKKPVDFGFVDFSTAARRRHFCQREIELNRRFAPALYEGLEALGGKDAGAAPEYAVRMRRFDPSATLDHLVA